MLLDQLLVDRGYGGRFQLNDWSMLADGKGAETQLWSALLKDADPYIACEAAYAAAYLGETAKGIERLNYPAKEADRKIGYSLLECLSLDKAMQPAIRVHLADLKDKAETLPRKANEDAGLMARGILVNLGEMDIKNLHGPESYKAGLKLNHGRRPMVPLPN